MEKELNPTAFPDWSWLKSGVGKSAQCESMTWKCRLRNRRLRSTEINPDKRPPNLHSRKRSTASDIGHKWRPTRIKAKRAPAEEAVARTRKPSPTMRDNVIPEISTVHSKGTFVFRPFVRGSEARSSLDGGAACVIRR